MYWINGVEAEVVKVDDRSFQYGDGCFTTMLTLNGSIHLWPLHKARMTSCLDLLGITYSNWEQVEVWLNQAVRPDEKAGVKLHISRGSGGRGYGTRGTGEPLVTISDFAFPEHYQAWLTEGIELGVCHHKLGHNPLLAGHKHNNRLEQVILKHEVEQQGVADAVALDIEDHVIETTMANLFWYQQGVLYTPAIDLAGVAGVARKRVLMLAAELGIVCKQGHYFLPDLYNAEEVFMTNSILGICPVASIAGHRFFQRTLTQQFQEMYYS